MKSLNEAIEGAAAYRDMMEKITSEREHVNTAKSRESDQERAQRKELLRRELARAKHLAKVRR